MKREISELMKIEHRKLREILINSGIEIEKNKYKAKKIFQKYLKKEIAHLSAENKIIFMHPKIKKMQEIKTLVKQHKEILKILEKMQNFLERYDYLNFDKNYTELIQLMKTHFRIEENSLYPEADSKFTDKEKEVLVSRIR